MARILVTGSSDGIGLAAAKDLVSKGHKVILHARSESRAKDASSACPGAETVLIGDLSSIAGTKKLATDANDLGTFDVIVHNAGVYRGGFRKTADGLPLVFAVNTVAPYILTCLMNRPKRLVYLSSGMHYSGDGSLKDITWKQRGERAWNDSTGYCDSKLHDVMLALAVARKWKGVVSNAMDPGWVPTKMGGSSAYEDINKSVRTAVGLALGEGKVKGTETGTYWVDSKQKSPKSETTDERKQDELLKICEEVSGVSFPTGDGTEGRVLRSSHH